jgi:hypothetical protein
VIGATTGLSGARGTDVSVPKNMPDWPPSDYQHVASQSRCGWLEASEWRQSQEILEDSEDFDWADGEDADVQATPRLMEDMLMLQVMMKNNTPGL